MAAKKIYTCRWCNEKNICPSEQVEGVDYVETFPGSHYYYHKKCYDKKISMEEDLHASADDKTWFIVLADYLTKDLKAKVNFPKTKTLWNSYIKNGKTAKGIYFAIKYFYDVKKYPVAQDKYGTSIGIVPYIYDESCAYWQALEIQQKGILDMGYLDRGNGMGNHSIKLHQ